MYKVKLKSFEGPFDLLVYLIENAQMSIYDIKISQITSQYLAYIKAMEEADVAVASEFMVLAAQLIEIKSKMILPRMNQDQDSLIEEDPRTELVARLAEYKRFKELAADLEERQERDQNIFEKPQEDISVYLENPDEYLSLGLSEFANAFKLFISKKQRVEAVRKHYTRVEREKETIERRMTSIAGRLKAAIGKVFNFKEFIHEPNDRYDVVVTFMSLLEMAKNRIVTVSQEKNYGDITVGAGECLESATISTSQTAEAAGTNI